MTMTEESRHFLTAVHIRRLHPAPGTVLRLDECANGHGPLNPDGAKPVCDWLRSWEIKADPITDLWIELQQSDPDLLDDPAIAQECKATRNKPAAGIRIREHTDDVFTVLEAGRKTKLANTGQIRNAETLASQVATGELNQDTATEIIAESRRSTAANYTPGIIAAARAMLPGGNENPPQS